MFALRPPPKFPGAGARASPVDEPELRVGPAVRAGIHAVGECPQRLVPLDAAAALARHVASADVHVHGGRVPVEAALDEPVGFGRPCVDAPLPLLLPPLLVRNPPAGALKVGELDALEEAEQVGREGGRSFTCSIL